MRPRPSPCAPIHSGANAERQDVPERAGEPNRAAWLSPRGWADAQRWVSRPDSYRFYQGPRAHRAMLVGFALEAGRTPRLGRRNRLWNETGSDAVCGLRGTGFITSAGGRGSVFPWAGFMHTFPRPGPAAGIVRLCVPANVLSRRGHQPGQEPRRCLVSTRTSMGLT